MNAEKIIIIGSGVSGLTTALALQLLGYETCIYTDKDIEKINDRNAHPEFASLFPSASVIPHSIYSDELQELFRTSQSFFYELQQHSFPGVSTRRHFEIYEFEPEYPEYRKWMHNFEPVKDLPRREVPRRFPSQEPSGWAFDCVFADWPLYFPAMRSCYMQSGGSIINRRLIREDLSSLSADTVVNCSGAGSSTLFDDPHDQCLVLRGHMIHKQGAPLITGLHNNKISYNYTPQASTYAEMSGRASDVYCYPRSDGWILGGSRQEGSLASGKWKAVKDNNVPSYRIDGHAVPRPIIDLNDEILSTTFGHSLNRSDELSALIGYRYIRNKRNGLRLDHETICDKTFYHNYGHGGAGVTLSWGCSLNIASNISSQSVAQIKRTLLASMK